jgi:hypothetical protein
MADDQAPPPVLFTPEGAEAFPEGPALLGGRCKSCGYVFFPMQSFGCERCGSVDLEAKALAGRGRLVASARVHMHAGAGRQAPFTVGSIITDDGAVVRSVLDVDGEGKLTPGVVMTARLVPETRPDRGANDLQFGVSTEGKA